ncbi:MAG: HlyD family type I secretion periplasmic adaptor subunit [Lentisphaerota bacterium]
MRKLLEKYWQKFSGQRIDDKELEFLPSVIEVLETPPSPVGRLVMWTILIVVMIALLWSVIGTVDEVVVAPGKIISIGFDKVVEAESQGKVSRINVINGQHVEKGDVLIEFDRQYSESDFNRLQKLTSYYKLEVERLTAELSNSPFNPDIKNYPGLASDDIRYEKELSKQRLSNYNTKVNTAKATVLATQASINVAKAKEEQYRQTLPKLKETEESFRELAKKGAVAKLELQQKELARIEVEQNFLGSQAEVAKAEADLNQSQQQLASVTSDWMTEIVQKMTETMTNLKSNEEELNKAKAHYNADIIKAPVSGIIYDLAVNTVGEVVMPDGKILSIVSDNAPLEVEAMVSTKDIGLIEDDQQGSVGQVADIKVETFTFQRYGVLTGHVRLMSAESTENKEQHSAYYKVYISLDKTYFMVQGKKNYVSPGMTVMAEIKTRKKRIFEFFLDPFRKYQSEAFREK